MSALALWDSDAAGFQENVAADAKNHPANKRNETCRCRPPDDRQEEYAGHGPHDENTSSDRIRLDKRPNPQ